MNRNVCTLFSTTTEVLKLVQYSKLVVKLFFEKFSFTSISASLLTVSKICLKCSEVELKSRKFTDIGARLYTNLTSPSQCPSTNHFLKNEVLNALQSHKLLKPIEARYHLTAR